MFYPCCIAIEIGTKESDTRGPAKWNGLHQNQQEKTAGSNKLKKMQSATS